MGTLEDKRHVDRLIKTHTARLKVLELRKAQQGTSSDPIVDTEIDELRAVLAELAPHQPSDKALEARQAAAKLYDNNVEFLIAQVGGLQNRQIKTESRQDDMATQVHELNKAVLSVAEDFADDKKDADRGRRRNLYLQVASIALSVIVLAVFLWLVFLR